MTASAPPGQRQVHMEAEHVALSPVLRTFERERLALFARYGFDGESRWVTDRAGRRTYLIAGGQGPCPTVLVHGGLSEAAEWSPLAGRIPGNVIIPDRPGCGLSYAIDYRGVDYRNAAAAWLLDLMDAIGADHVDLIGNSMGGFFAIAFALAHPERVRRLVLVGAPAGLDRKLPLFPCLWGNPIMGPVITKLKISDPETLRRRVFATLLVAHPERVPLDLLEIMVTAATLPGVDRAAYSMLRRVTSLRGFRPELMLRSDLTGLSLPTRFVWGDADAFAAPSSGREMVAMMSDASIDVIQDAGHLPWLDQPDSVAAAISELSAPRRASQSHV